MYGYYGGLLFLYVLRLLLRVGVSGLKVTLRVLEWRLQAMLRGVDRGLEENVAGYKVVKGGVKVARVGVRATIGGVKAAITGVKWTYRSIKLAIKLIKWTIKVLEWVIKLVGYLIKIIIALITSSVVLLILAVLVLVIAAVVGLLMLLGTSDASVEGSSVLVGLENAVGYVSGASGGVLEVDGAFAGGSGEISDYAHKDARGIGKQMPWFVQGSGPWSGASTGGGTISLNGCGYCSMSVIYSYWTGVLITPDKMAKWWLSEGMPGGAMQNEIVLNNSKWWEKRLGLKVMDHEYPMKGRNSDKGRFDAMLAQGYPIVIKVGPGVFTKGGHYLVVYAREGDNYYVIDSGTSKRPPSKAFKWSDINNGIKASINDNSGWAAYGVLESAKKKVAAVAGSGVSGGVAPSGSVASNNSDVQSVLEGCANTYIKSGANYSGGSMNMTYNGKTWSTRKDCTGFASFFILHLAGASKYDSATSAMFKEGHENKKGELAEAMRKLGYQTIDVDKVNSNELKCGDLLIVNKIIEEERNGKKVKKYKHHVEIVYRNLGGGQLETFGWGSTQTKIPSSTMKYPSYYDRVAIRR